MPVTATPIFVQTVKTTCLNVSVANTNRDGSTGTYSSALTIGANGGLLESIKVVATVTTTAGMVRIFYADDGTNYDLIAEIPVTAYTVSGTQPAFGNNSPTEGLWVPPGGRPLNLTAGSKIKASTHNGEAMGVFVSHGDL